MALHPVPSASFQITALITELFENRTNPALLFLLLLLFLVWPLFSLYFTSLSIVVSELFCLM